MPTTALGTKVGDALKSSIAIAIYVIVAASGLGIITGYYLIVPLLRNTCTIFTNRCTRMTVLVGPQSNGVSTLLVNIPSTGFSYYYDGAVIYSYGNNLKGTCPSQITTGMSRDPVLTSVAIDSKTADTCMNFNAAGECVVVPSVVCTKPATYDASSKLVSPCVPSPSDPDCICVTSGLDAEKPCTKALKYNCNNGNGDEGTWQSGSCCDTEVHVACSAGSTCVEWSPFVDGKFKCASETTPLSFEHCCECSTNIVLNHFDGTVNASGDILEPVFVVDAKTMALLDGNNGIYCGKKLGILLNNDFKDAEKLDFTLPVPLSNNELNVYQLFDVLKKKGIFKLPAPVPVA